MTLVAELASGDRVDLTAVSDHEWEELRARAPALKCVGCRGKMHTYEVQLVTAAGAAAPATTLRIFRHNPGYAERCRLMGWQESAEHDLLKTRLAEGARRAGWNAQVEVWHDESCRADVVATHPTSGNQHALEAQLATLSTHDALERHGRYVDAFGACTWTHSGRREWSKRIPSLRVTYEAPTTVVGGVLVDPSEDVEADPMPVVQVIDGVLRNQIIYIYDNNSDWGTYVLRDSLTRSTNLRRRRSPRQVRGDAKRFCDRMAKLGTAELALLTSGFADLDDFRAALERAHRSFRTGSVWVPSELPSAEHAALALAGEHPELKSLAGPALAPAGLSALFN